VSLNPNFMQHFYDLVNSLTYLFKVLLFFILASQFLCLEIKVFCVLN